MDNRTSTKIEMAKHKSATTRPAGRIKDARGQSVTQLDPVAMHVLHQYDVIEANTLRAIANEKGVRIAGWERTWLAVGILSALLVISLFTHATITGDISDATMAKSAGLIFMCFIPWTIWYRIKWGRFGHVAAAMLKYSRCPHCGYDLRFLPTDPEDGATVCPECGCAWSLGGTPTNSTNIENSSND
jgi:hypothetical protein